MKMSVPLQHLFAYPIHDLLAAMPAADDPVWDTFAARQNKVRTVHRATRSIAFVWSEGWNGQGEPLVLWPDYAPAPLRQAVADCTEQLRRHFGGKVTRVILAEMPPGGEIAEHRDGAPLLEMTHRCHVPIVTNDAVSFFIDGEDHRLLAGEAYELDNMRKHAVVNGGAERRIHLICNVLPPADQRGT